MERLDGHFRVLGAELDEDDAPVRLQRLADRLKHFVGMIEFVIDVHHQDQVQRVALQLRVGDGAKHTFDVRDFPLRHFFGEQVEHFLLDIDGVNEPAFADRFRHAPTVVAGARADIRHGVARFELQGFEQKFRFLLVFAFRAFQPVRRLMAHDVGDFAAEVKFADAVGVVLLTVFVTRVGISLQLFFRSGNVGGQTAEQAGQKNLESKARVSFHAPRLGRFRFEFNPLHPDCGRGPLPFFASVGP